MMQTKQDFLKEKSYRLGDKDGSRNYNQLSLLKLLITCVLVGVLGRLMPHLPNVTPMTSLSLFVGSKLRRIMAFLVLFVTLAISDILLAYFYNYPIFSLWTVFSYSGFMMIALFGRKFANNLSWKLFPCWIGGISFGYWLWTNLGVWLTSSLYAKNFSGLINCYIFGLPFLRTALIGDFIWGVIIFGMFSLVKRHKCVDLYADLA